MRVLKGCGMNHSEKAIAYRMGSTWDLDRTAEIREWEGVDIGYDTHRDADVLNRSNWEVIIEQMEENFGLYDGWNVDSLGHWAVGWVEFITFDTARTDIREYFDDIRSNLADYPILDEMRFSNMEWEENHPNGDKECYCEDEDCSIKLAIMEEANASIDD